MDDRYTMENLLMTEKGVCDLYLHATVEAGSANVKQTFNKALNDALCMQGDIYAKMSEKGWYPAQQAQDQQMQQVRNKFSGGSSGMQ